MRLTKFILLTKSILILFASCGDESTVFNITQNCPVEIQRVNEEELIQLEAKEQEGEGSLEFVSEVVIDGVVASDEHDVCFVELSQNNAETSNNNTSPTT